MTFDSYSAPEGTVKSARIIYLHLLNKVSSDIGCDMDDIPKLRRILKIEYARLFGGLNRAGVVPA